MDMPRQTNEKTAAVRLVRHYSHRASQLGPLFLEDVRSIGRVNGRRQVLCLSCLFLVADASCSSDESALPGVARQLLTFLASPRKGKQKKATAKARPLRGSQDR